VTRDHERQEHTCSREHEIPVMANLDLHQMSNFTPWANGKSVLQFKVQV
jgi:hypothetical protein